MENRAKNTISENIRKAIQNFDNIESALQTQRMDTTNKNVEEYSNLIGELSNTNDATATADDIISSKTAYINGKKIEGNIQKEFDKTSLIFGSYITNNTGLGIYDIRYDLGYALVGNRDATDFYVCKIVDNVINLTNATKFNIRTNVSSSRNYIVKDLKFNAGDIENDIVRFYGIGNYNTTDGYASSQYLWHRIFVIDYNTKTAEFSVISTEFTDSAYISPNPGRGTPDMNDYITIIEKDILLYKPGKIKNYGLDYNRVINPPRRIFKFENNSFSVLSSFKRPHSSDSIYSDAPTNSYISKNIYIEYRNDTYLIYSLDASYQFTLMKSGTDHASNRVAIIADSYYLLGNNLYDTNNNLLMTYTNLAPSLYKLYSNGYIYEFNTSSKITNIYKFDEDTFEIELINTITSSVSSYGIDVVAINSRPLSVKNDYICYASTDGKTYYIDYSGTSEIVKTLIRTGIRYTDTNDTTAKAEHIVIGKSAYLSGEKVKGTMPNNGTLNYTPSTEEQIIPKGYTDGGIIAAIEEGTETGTGTILDVTNNSSISIEGTTLVISDDFTVNYTQVEYIESSGTQYIDTGVKPTHNTSAKIEFSITKATSGQDYPKIYGCSSTSNGAFFLQADTITNIFRTVSYQNIDGYRANATTTFSYGKKYEIVHSRNTLLIDGTFHTSVDLSAYNSDINIFIFVLNSNGTPNAQYAYAKLYSMKIYENEDLVRDFMPCYRKSDNVIGLYDKVNKQFYTNAGSGAFSKGDDV